MRRSAAGADAMHPGYGFLSENAAFAEACADAGLRFVGPPPAAMRGMGSKSAAKALMAAAGVPLSPGYHGERPGAGLPAPTEAARIGFPLVIKAASGGGGKGMRVVDSAARRLRGGWSPRSSEAAAAFGDDRVLLERYLQRAAPHRSADLCRYAMATRCICSSVTAPSSAATRK